MKFSPDLQCNYNYNCILTGQGRITADKDNSNC